MTPTLGNQVTDVQVVKQPSKSYAWDTDTGRIGGVVDGLQAILQSANKILMTRRYGSEIYTGGYGNSLKDLIGQDASLVTVALKREIRESLLYDDRILTVTNFVITQIDGTSFDVKFLIETIEGDINLGVEVTI